MSMGDLLHTIKTVIESNNVPYSEAKQEVPVGRGSADIVVYDRSGAPALVFELKQPDGSPVHDPYYPDVVEQACAYAGALGISYFVTSNFKHFVVWKTFQEGTPLLERQLLHYDAAAQIETTIERILSDLQLIKEGKMGFLSISKNYEVFVHRLRTFHEVLCPALLDGLEEKIKKDKMFRNTYIEWLFEQDFAISSETNEKIIKQYSYLLSNKILFYKMLEANKAVREIADLPKLLRIETDSDEHFRKQLAVYFGKAMDIDYEAVFSSTFFDNLPLGKESIKLFNGFISELEKYKLSEIDYDILGKVFESLIPAEERHYLGQYYTRADVVDFIEAFCIKSADDAIFDPACGSGTFLIRAYYNLKNKAKQKKHKELLSQIYGTEINQFAAHLSVINLTIRDVSELTNKVNVLINDFFKLGPKLSVFLPFSGKNMRNKSQTINIPKFDAVVANPPYTRQEELGEYSKTYKELLESVIREEWGGRYTLGKRAGIHAYFLMHAPKFLKPDGRLGFIVSNSWMDADYGKEIQKMLLENFRIKAIIESKAERWFDDAAVNTCIIIAEKEADAKKREQHKAKFVLLKKKLQEYSVETLAKKIEGAGDLCDDENCRIYCISQAELWNEGLAFDEKGKREWVGAKWGKYLRAPAVFFRLLRQKDKIRLLPEIADIKYGIKTGCTKFFIKKRRSAKKLGIEQRFLTPIIHSTKELKKPVLKDDEIDYVLFSTNLDKVALRGTNARSYIEMGEALKMNEGKSMKGRKYWWDVGVQEPPAIILTQFYNERHFAAYNKNGVQIENTFFGITPHNEKLTLALAAYLNSSLFALTKELYGRLNMGEGVLTIYGPDWKQMPVLDLEKLGKEDIQRLEKAFASISRREVLPVSEEIKKDDKKRLDDIVFEILGMSQKDRKEVYKTLADLVAERTTKANSVRKSGAQRKIKKENNGASALEQKTLFDIVL